MKPNTIQTLACSLLLAFSSLGASAFAINISGDVQSPRVEFAMGDLKKACAEVQPALVGSDILAGDPAQLLRVVLKGPTAVLPPASSLAMLCRR